MTLARNGIRKYVLLKPSADEKASILDSSEEFWGIRSFSAALLLPNSFVGVS